MVSSISGIQTSEHSSVNTRMSSLAFQICSWSRHALRGPSLLRNRQSLVIPPLQYSHSLHTSLNFVAKSVSSPSSGDPSTCAFTSSFGSSSMSSVSISPVKSPHLHFSKVLRPIECLYLLQNLHLISSGSSDPCSDCFPSSCSSTDRIFFVRS